MNASAIDRIMTDIGSSELARQVRALDEFLSFSTEVRDDDKRKVVSASVRLLETSSNPLAVASRISRFDQTIVPPLEDLFRKTTSAEVRTLASLVLLRKGSMIGVSILLREIEQRGAYRSMACTALANAGVVELVPVIVGRLRDYAVDVSAEFPTTADDEVLTMLDILKRLHIRLPDEIAAKFSAPSAPAFFQKAMAEYCSD